MFLKISSHFFRSLADFCTFLSGWYCKQSLRYLRLISSDVAVFGTPRTEYGLNCGDAEPSGKLTRSKRQRIANAHRRSILIVSVVSVVTNFERNQLGRSDLGFGMCGSIDTGVEGRRPENAIDGPRTSTHMPVQYLSSTAAGTAVHVQSSEYTSHSPSTFFHSSTFRVPCTTTAKHSRPHQVFITQGETGMAHHLTACEV